MKKLNIPVSIICLQSHAEKRCTPSTQFLKHFFNNVNVQKAITPSDFDIQENFHPYSYVSMLQGEKWTDANIDSPNQVACAKSHIASWKRCVQQNMPIIIAEDDIFNISYKDMQNVLQNFRKQLLVQKNIDICRFRCRYSAFY